MSGSTSGPPRRREASAHPAGLLRAERPYLVRWGAREMALSSLAAAGAAAVVLALAALFSGLWLLSLALLLPAWALSVLFFRNPRRRVPREPGVLVAPADGRVLEVGLAEEEEYIGGPAHKVAIFLSIFDVHVNRAPCGGEVEYLRHRPGRHLDARDPRGARENEAQAIGILRSDPGGPAGVKVLVRQVSGALARRIVCPLETGQELERGKLLGMIKYGSRTELCVAAAPGGPLPVPQVRVGDHVVGGETVLYRYPASAPEAPQAPAGS